MMPLHSVIPLILACLISAGHTAASEGLFSGKKSLQHIVNQTDFGPRSPDNPQAKRQTLNYIQQTLHTYTDQIQVQSFSSRGLSGNNLWARISGRGDGYIMLGAHWDTRPLHSSDSSAVNLGANDGASGVAVLLELARVVSQSAPPVTVDLVFFDLEDMGKIDGLPYAMGSKAFVKANPDYRPSAGVIVDMVCDKSLSIPRERHSQKRAKAVLDQLWAIAASQEATAFKNRRGTFITDDHLPFLDAGIPVVDLIHWPFPSYWHSRGDTLENCSPHSLEQVGRVLEAFIYSYITDKN